MSRALRLAFAFVLLVAGGAATALAFSPPPFGSETAQVDSLFAKAASGGAGIEDLKRTVRNKDTDLSVKIYALEKIGELGRPEEDGFLVNVSSNAREYLIDEGEVSLLRDAARRAHLKSRVIREPRLSGKRALLVNALTGDQRSWATDELCNLGDSASLPLIRKTISSIDSTRGTNRISLCESKVNLLSKHAKRIDGLKAALTAEDVDIRRWGVQQLGNLRTIEADTALINQAIKFQKASKDEGLLNVTIDTLRKRGWDGERLETRGIRRRH